MNELKQWEMMCKVRAIEATLLAGPFKQDYLMYLNYFDSKIVEEMHEELGKDEHRSIRP